MKNLIFILLSISAHAFAINNTRFGNDALKNDSGFENSAFGFSALRSLEKGTYNSAFGYGALEFLKEGLANLALGRHAGQNLRKGNQNIYIGHLGSMQEDLVIYLGNSNHKNCFIGGIFGSEIGKGSRVVVIDDKGKLSSSPVSYETLMKIEKMLPQLEALLQKQLEPEG